MLEQAVEIGRHMHDPAQPQRPSVDNYTCQRGLFRRDLATLAQKTTQRMPATDCHQSFIPELWFCFVLSACKQVPESADEDRQTRPDFLLCGYFGLSPSDSFFYSDRQLYFTILTVMQVTSLFLHYDMDMSHPICRFLLVLKTMNCILPYSIRHEQKNPLE